MLIKSLLKEYNNFPPKNIKCIYCVKLAIFLSKREMKLTDNDHVCKRGTINARAYFSKS